MKVVLIGCTGLDAIVRATRIGNSDLWLLEKRGSSGRVFPAGGISAPEIPLAVNGGI